MPVRCSKAGERDDSLCSAWVDAVEQCLLEADLRLPKRTDRRELSEFAPTMT